MIIGYSGRLGAGMTYGAIASARGCYLRGASVVANLRSVDWAEYVGSLPDLLAVRNCVVVLDSVGVSTWVDEPEFAHWVACARPNGNTVLWTGWAGVPMWLEVLSDVVYRCSRWGPFLVRLGYDVVWSDKPRCVQFGLLNSYGCGLYDCRELPAV